MNLTGKFREDTLRKIFKNRIRIKMLVDGTEKRKRKEGKKREEAGREEQKEEEREKREKKKERERGSGGGGWEGEGCYSSTHLISSKYLRMVSGNANSLTSHVLHMI